MRVDDKDPQGLAAGVGHLETPCNRRSYLETLWRGQHRGTVSHTGLLSAWDKPGSGLIPCIACLAPPPGRTDEELGNSWEC